MSCDFSWEGGKPPKKIVINFSGPMKSYPITENHIGSVVSKILRQWYRQTYKQGYFYFIIRILIIPNNFFYKAKKLCSESQQSINQYQSSSTTKYEPQEPIPSMLQSEDQIFKNGLPKPIFSHGVTQGVTQSSRGSPRKAKESKRYADYDFEDFKVILIEWNHVIFANFKYNFNKGKYHFGECYFCVIQRPPPPHPPQLFPSF